MYSVHSDNPENTGIYAASLAHAAEPVRLLSTHTNALYAPGAAGKNYLLWLRGAALVAQEFDLNTLKLIGEPHPVAEPLASTPTTLSMNAAVSANGMLLYSSFNTLSQLTWLDRGGKPLAVIGEPGEYSSFRLGPDGRQIATSRDWPGGTDLWLLDVERGVPSRLTFNLLSIYPVWSPEGRTILFTSNARDLYRKDARGGGIEHRITPSQNTAIANDWSRDGRSVLYYEVAPNTQRDLWILPVTPEGRPAGDAKPRPYLQTRFNEWAGRFSPEARPNWVAFTSDDSGRNEIYIDAFPEPRSKTRISTSGGSFPQWSQEGRELFYVSSDYKLMAVALKVGADSIEPSAPRELFPLPAVDTGVSPYEVAPDGKRFLVRATPDQTPRPLTVIVNWPALLKKGGAAP